MSLLIPALCASVLMDSEKFHANILAHLSSDPVVGDSPYTLIGSAGMELKAKNIYKKGHKSLKTQFLTCIH